MLDKHQKNTIIPLLKEAGLMEEKLKFGCIVKYKLGNERVIKNNGNFFKTNGRQGFSSYKIERFQKSKIIGQYHLGSLIGRFLDKGYLFNPYNDAIQLEKGDNYIEFDGDVPAMERSEKTNKELAEFMVLISKGNKDAFYVRH